MKNQLPRLTRMALGLLFFVFGAAGLFNLIPPPPDMPEKLAAFTQGLMASGYFFPLLKSTETICGLLLILGIAPALVLVVLAPITINIFMTHAFLTPGLENLVLPLIIGGLHVFTARQYWDVYKPLFKKRF